jgi:hypothetical protein
MGAGASNSSVAVSSSDTIHLARQHAQLACAQLTTALCKAKVLARVGVKVDLTFARQTLEFKVTQAMINSASDSAKTANVFPPESVLGMVRDVQRLTAMVAARNLDAVFETATATRCFTAGEATFLVSVSVDPHDYINARRPSLIQGKTVEQVGDVLEQSLTTLDAAALSAAPPGETPAPEAEGAVEGAAPVPEGEAAPTAESEPAGGETKDGDSEKSIEKLKKGILVTKHPRKGSPEARTFWFTGDRFCVAKKLQKKVSNKTKGWSVDDPNGFDVIKGHDSPVFERTIKKYGAVDADCCLSVQLHDRTIDLQFDSTETRNMVYTAIKTFLPEMGEPMEKKFTQSLGIGIGKRAVVQKVVVDGAGAVNDVRIGDVILEINGSPISATMSVKAITELLSSSIKDKGEVLVKFARLANADVDGSGSEVVLTETQQNVNELMDLMFRAAGKLSHYHTGTGERHVEVSCKHPLTELMVALKIVDTKDLTASPERSPSPAPEGIDVTNTATEGKNTDLVDGAVELLNSNLLPVSGATAAISEGSAQLKDLNGSIVMHCTIADNTSTSESNSTPVSPDKKLENIPAPPELAREGSMLDLGKKKGDSIGRTNSVLARRNSEVTQQNSDVGQQSSEQQNSGVTSTDSV